MKRNAWFGLAVVVVLAMTGGARAQGANVDAFYDALAPYGSWFEQAPYGWVWQPAAEEVGGDFVPYQTGGYWTYTDQGWSFETDWPWEWAVFHYGRWVPDGTYGWLWIPDSVWGPSWVDWRTGDGYVGWTPLGPTEVVIEPVWIFVEVRYFCSGWIEPHVLPRSRHHEILHATKVAHEEKQNGTARWFMGPPRMEIERQGGRPVPTAVVRAPPAPGQVRAGEMVRPASRPPGAPPVRSAGIAGAPRAVATPAARPLGIRPAPPTAPKPATPTPAPAKGH